MIIRNQFISYSFNIMPLQFLKGTSDQVQLFYENHLYYQTRPNYWTCKDNFCNVTLKTGKTEANELEVVKAPTLRHCDNQINNDDYLCRIAIKEIKDRILKEVDTLPRAIFDQEIRRLQTEHKLEPATIATFIKPYASLQSTFEKKRAKVRPKLPNTEEDIDFSIPQSINYTNTIDHKPFMRYDNKKKDHRIIIFASDHGLKLLAQANRWHSDGTFFMTPKQFKQTYIIHAYKSSNVMYPCAYILLQKKDKETYKEMLAALKEIAFAAGHELNPQTVLTDFEKAVQEAFKFHWTNISIRGCYFHLKQAILRWVFQHGYKKQYLANTKFNFWLKSLTSLAMVPVKDIDRAYAIVKSNVPDNIEVKPILDYFEKTWLNGQWKPAVWNHYDDDGPRSNNHAEAFNRVINAKLMSSHPNIWKYIDFLKKLDNKMVIEMSAKQSIKLPYYMNKQSKEVKARAQHESELRDEYDSGSISLDEYIERFSSSVNFYEALAEVGDETDEELDNNLLLWSKSTPNTDQQATITTASTNPINYDLPEFVFDSTTSPVEQPCYIQLSNNATSDSTTSPTESSTALDAILECESRLMMIQERSIEQIDTSEQNNSPNQDDTEQTKVPEDDTTEPKIVKPLLLVNSKKRKRFSFASKSKSPRVDSSQSPKSPIVNRPKTVRGKELLKRLAEAVSEDEDDEPFNYIKGITNYDAIEANMRLYREYNNPARREQDFEAEIAKITDADVEKEVLRFWEEHDITNRKRKSKKDKTDARLRLEYKIRRVCRSQNSEDLRFLKDHEHLEHLVTQTASNNN